MNFPIAMVKGDRTDRAFGVRGFPSAVLVDARGNAVWIGHPGSFPESSLEALLAAQTWIPRLENKKHSKINKSLAKREIGKAYAAVLKALERTPEDEELLARRQSIESAAERMLADAQSKEEEADYGVALDYFEEVVDLFGGMEAADTARVAAKALEKNPEAKDELAAHKLLARARAYLADGDERKALPRLKSVVKKYQGTHSHGRAEALLRRHGG